MALLRLAIVALAAVLFLCSVSTNGVPTGPHINDLNILLPPRATHSVRYRLQGSGGCFSWTWDHHDIVDVEAEYNGTEGCSTSAVVTSVAPFSGRRATAVQATDSLTGQVIRCEVFIDMISRVRIFHHSLKLDLDGLATLRIRAFDSEDNVFSSLVGMQFLWKFLPISSSGETLSHSLVHVPLKDTPLTDCGCICGDIDTQIQLEHTGMGSDLFVVRGVSVGQERVRVSMSEMHMQDLGDEIILTVAEAIFLEPPSPLYIIPGTRVQYCLKTLRQNMPSVIQLPSAHHHWSVSNTSVAVVDQSLGLVFGQMIGSTIVLVEDLRVAGHHQMASLYVVKPISLLLYLSPIHSKGVRQQSVLKREPALVSSDVPWYLVVGWDYVVQVLAFSQESASQPLYLTKNNDLRLSFGDFPFWNTLPIPEDVASEQGWRNGTLVKAISEGSGRIVAILRYSDIVADEVSSEVVIRDKQVLTVEQKMRVCSCVRILFENNQEGSGNLMLPWNPKQGQQYQLIAKGGCAEKAMDYRWTTSDASIVSVSSNGVVQSKGLGKAVIQVAVVTNLMNFDEVVVEVSVPTSMAVVEGLPVEVEIGSHLPVAVTLRNPAGLCYSKCDSFHSVLHWEIFTGEGTFLRVNDTNHLQEFPSTSIFPGSIHHSACAWAHFLAVKPGRATVTASLNFDSWFKITPSITHAFPVLEISRVVSAYLPLMLEQAGDGRSHGGYDCDLSELEDTVSDLRSRHYGGHSELLLVPGSSMKVMLRGGPERWRQGVEFIERHDVIVDSHEGVAMEKILVTLLSSSGGRFYQITCISLGSYTLIFYRGNHIGEDHPTPTIATVSLSVICSIPSMITLLIDEPGNSRTQIKASAHADRDASRTHVTPITVVNSRSIRVAAVALDDFGSPFANASSLFLNWTLKDCESLAYWDRVAAIAGGHWEQYLVLEADIGQCIVRASAGFVIDELSVPSVKLAADDLLKQREQFLTDAVTLLLVTPLRLEPKSILLYLDLDAKARLTVLGGTGNIESHINDSRVAVVVEQPPRAGSIFLTVAARGLGTALITVHDIGLASPSFDTVLVHVADVAWVRMLLPDEMAIALGSTLTVKLQAGDSFGNVFEDSQLNLMSIQVYLQDEVLELFSNEGVLKASGSRVMGSSFVVHGASVGRTNNLYVSVWSNSGQEILSDFGKIEVYAPLSIHPVGLVLAPGARYVVRVHGGPSTGVIQFSSCNETVAFIETTFGMLVANFPGIVEIIANAYNHAGDTICQASMKISVQIPVSMVLNVRDAQLGVGQEMSIFPSGTEEDLFSFFELCGEYKWEVGDEKVLSFRHAEIFATKHDLNDFFYGKDNTSEKGVGEDVKINVYDRERVVDSSFSRRVIGRAAGKADVTVSFSCKFQSKTVDFPRMFYIASGTVRVASDPPLALGMLATWLLPPHFTTSNLLPQPKESVSEVRSPGSRKSITYSILHEGGSDTGGITLAGGHIKTSDRNELACIQARDRRTGRSEIAVCVRVAEVAHMTVGDQGFPPHVFDLSMGTHQIFSPTLRDQFGIPFFQSGGGNSLLAVTNRADILHIRVPDVDEDSHPGNATIAVQTLREGTALVRVYDKKNLAVADYILIRVGAFISPKNPFLHTGVRVNFSVMGKGLSSTEHGQWSSGNEGVIHINKLTGEAIAVGPGKASVSFNSSRLVTYTTVTVVEVASVGIGAPAGILTNAPYPDQGYRFPVIFSDSQGHDVGMIAGGQEISYNCHLTPSYLGRCSLWRDPKADNFYCVFFPYPPEKLFLMLQQLPESSTPNLSVGDSRGVVPIRITVEVPGTSEVGTVETSFAGGFTILDNPIELHLLPSTNRSRLTIVGSAGGVQLSWTRRDAMDVKRISGEKDAFGVGGHAVYEVKALDIDKPFTSKLALSLSTNGQHEEVNVRYDAGHFGTPALSGQIVTVVIVTVVLVVLPLIACARLLGPLRVPRETRITSPVSEPGSEGGSDRSPLHIGTSMSSADNLQTPQPLSSSRSPPQPYTDYVSRTIENTPYFRREGFRRFDPTRTY